MTSYILTKHDAKEFLDSREGSVLRCVRAMRDATADDLKVYCSSERDEQWIDDMIAYNGGYGQLLHKFKEDHEWGRCARVEALQLLCLRAAKLERLAAGAPVERALQHA